MTKKKAFTFVEVMITIAILGIIAALIIPTLLAGINERRWITGCKKAYTTLSQATDAAILDRGPLKDWPESLSLLCTTPQYNKRMPAKIRLLDKKHKRPQRLGITIL